MEELKVIIDKFKMDLEAMVKRLLKFKDIIDMYYNINNDIINRYEINKYRNYNLLTNINNINDNIDKEIEKLRLDSSYGYN